MDSLSITLRFIKNISNAVRGIPAVTLANLLLTRQCTQNCLQCSISQNIGDEPFMLMEHFRFLVDRLECHGTQFINLSGGEPILHPHIEEIIRYTAGKHFVHVQLLSTLYASRTVVERVIDVLLETGTGIQVSFDGFDEVADTLRGATNVSDTVRRSMELLTRKNKNHRKPIRTSANIVVNRKNLHQVPDILSFIESLGWKCNVDLYRWVSSGTNEVEELKVEDCSVFREVLNRMKTSLAVTTPRFIIDGFTDYLNGRTPKRCPYLDSRSFGTKIYVNPDASVTVCLGESFGNLLEQTLPELFESDEWKQRIIEMKACRGCWNSCYTPSGIVFSPRSFNDIRVVWEIVRKG